MKSNSKIFSFFCLLMLFPFAIFGKNILTNLESSADINQIQKCEKYYEKICSVPDANNLMEEIAKQWPCMEEKMQYNKSCKQAYLIRKNTGYPPDKMQKYDKGIVVFKVTTIADGQTVFYLIDKEGKFIELTQDEKLINTNQTYVQLKKKYPNLSFTSFVFWSKVFEDTFPKAYSSNNSGLQLIFKQELRDGPCVACKPVGVASVSYIFDDKGKFYGIKLLKIKLLPKVKP